MTKKDYELIAGAIRRSGQANCSALERNQVRRQAKENMRRLIVSDLVGTLKHDNPRFDEERFLKACGVEPNVMSGPVLTTYDGGKTYWSGDKQLGKD